MDEYFAAMTERQRQRFEVLFEKSDHTDRAVFLCHLTAAVMNAVLDQQLSGVVFLGDSKAPKVG